MTVTLMFIYGQLLKYSHGILDPICSIHQFIKLTHQYRQPEANHLKYKAGCVKLRC